MTTLQADVDPSNAAQLRAWDGDEGAYWAAHAERFDRSVAAYDPAFLAAAAITPTDRVLDIGCGTGAITRAVGRRTPAGSALGVDLSAAMLAVAARVTAEEDLDRVRFLRADAQTYPFEAGAFDVAVSRTGVMFFGDPAAAFANIARALRRGGRLVLLVWQSVPDNPWIVEILTALAAGRPVPVPPPDAPGPFSLADPERTAALLTGAGFGGVRVEDRREPMHFGADPDDACRFAAGLAGWMLADLDAAGRERALGALHAAMRARDTPAGVRFPSAAWLVTATRD